MLRRAAYGPDAEGGIRQCCGVAVAVAAVAGWTSAMVSSFRTGVRATVVGDSQDTQDHEVLATAGLDLRCHREIRLET